MAFQVFENADQGATFVVTLVSLPICIGVTAIRFAVLFRSGRKIAAEDWFALAALLFYLPWAVFAIVLVIVENGTKAMWNMTEFDPTVWRQMIQTGYVVQIIFGLQQTAAKLSLLIFYHRVFSIHRTFTRISFIVGGFQIAYCIAWVFTAIFMCNPPRKAWEPLIDGTCLDLSIVLASTESINSAVDFVMVGMAIYIVRTLEISRSNKWKLGTLFAFGGLTGLLGFVRIGMAYGTVGDSDHVVVYMILQMASGIICCCVPIYRAAFMDLPFLRSIRSMFRSANSSRNASSSGGRSGRPSFKTIGQRSTKEKKPGADEEWLQLDEASSTRHLATTAWAERDHPPRRQNTPFATQTVEFRQTVENV